MSARRVFFFPHAHPSKYIFFLFIFFFFLFFFFSFFLFSTLTVLRYPGPASYEKGAVESQPQYSPIPGPGYSSGALLQMAETHTHHDPMPPSIRPNDYQTLISNDQNLKIRMARNVQDADKDTSAVVTDADKESTNKNKKLVDELMSMGVKPSDVQFLDTGALSGAAVGGGVAASAGVSGVGGLRKNFATSAIDTIDARANDEAAAASAAPLLTASAKTESALAAEYDAAHDPYLGLRPEDSRSALSTTSLLETSIKIKSKAKGFSLASMAGAAAGGAAAMGVGINCPDGMPFCRKALRRIGKRSLARRERRDAKNQEMSETMASVDVVIQDLKKDTRYFGSMELQTFQQSIQKIVSEYLHDYSDEEICSDIGMCSVGNNPGQLPIAKSAFDTIRL